MLACMLLLRGHGEREKSRGGCAQRRLICVRRACRVCVRVTAFMHACMHVIVLASLASSFYEADGNDR